MITDAILSFFTNISGILLTPLTIVNVAVDLVTSIPVVGKFLTIVAYVIPWNNLVPLFVIIFAMLFLRIAIAILRFIMSLLPGT